MRCACSLACRAKWVAAGRREGVGVGRSTHLGKGQRAVFVCEKCWWGK